MRIYLEKDQLKENLHTFLRRCGYQPLKDSYIRSLIGFNYPSFHIYFQETEKQFILNLHLDQKKPSYKKQKAHSGEYQGKIVEKEAERIKGFLK